MFCSSHQLKVIYRSNLYLARQNSTDVKPVDIGVINSKFLAQLSVAGFLFNYGIWVYLGRYFQLRFTTLSHLKLAKDWSALNLLIG